MSNTKMNRDVVPDNFTIGLVIGIIVASVIGNMGDVLRGCRQFPQVILFVLGLIGMGLMGYFAKNLDSTDVKSNWIEQITNSLAQLFIFIGLLMFIF